MIYAVNKRTKDHRIHTPGYPSGLEEYFVEADADGWISHDGNECPLPDGNLCDVRVRSGSENFGVPANKHIGKKWPDAGPAFWECEGVPGDIIAYRPILDAKPDAPMPEQGTDATTPRRPFLDSGRLRERFGPFDVSPPAWNGEGLPPVGIRCEALRSHGWVEVYVVGYCEDGYCVFDTGSEFKGNKDPNKFRPIRSEEDRSIDAMIAAAGLDDEGYNREVCRDLLRAGYRKTATTDGEDT